MGTRIELVSSRFDSAVTTTRPTQWSKRIVLKKLNIKFFVEKKIGGNFSPGRLDGKKVRQIKSFLFTVVLSNKRITPGSKFLHHSKEQQIQKSSEREREREKERESERERERERETGKVRKRYMKEDTE